MRHLPDEPIGVGVLTVAGSSGRLDDVRARTFARGGAIAESIRWFGGEGQNPGPWEIPLESFLARVDALAVECDRVVVAGTSFGSEAALLTGVHSNQVDAVIGFAPSDVVWAGITDTGRVTSHWTLDGRPLPFVPFSEAWRPDREPPSYAGLYSASRAAFPEAAVAACIEVERIPEVLLVAGGDDRVWPATEHADRIRERRLAHGLTTTVIQSADAGHRTLLPTEERVVAGQTMARGGTEAADRRLGERACAAITRMLAGSAR